MAVFRGGCLSQDRVWGGGFGNGNEFSDSMNCGKLHDWMISRKSMP